MPVVAIGFFVGVLAICFLPGLDYLGVATVAVMAIVAITSGYVIAKKFQVSLERRVLHISVISFIIGVAWTSWHVIERRANQLARHCEGQDITVVGKVDSFPKKYHDHQRFELSIKKTVPRSSCFSSLPNKIQLSWYGENERILKLGDLWQLTVKLKRPHGLSNPGVFDYEKYLFSRKIMATGYVRKSEGNRLIETAPSFSVQAWRSWIKGRISQLGREHSETGLMLTLVLGDRSEIGVDQREVFRRTGISHLIAISGLHVGLLVGWVFFSVRWGWSLSGRLSAIFTPVDMATLSAATVGVIYSLLAGFALPTERAVIMALLVLGGVCLRRQIRQEHIYLIALFGVTLLNPISPLDPGFWLSFLAVLIIAYTLRRHRNRPKWQQFLLVQGYLTLGMMPLQWLFFESISTVSPIVNLVLIPVFSLIVVPLTLVVALLSVVSQSIGSLLVPIVLDIYGWILIPLSWISGLELSQVELSPLSPFALLLSTGCVGLSLYVRRIGVKIGALAIIAVIMVFLFRDRPEYGEVRMTVLDVGQGLSVLIETQKHVLIYDAGPGGYGIGNAATRVIIPSLRYRNIKRVDKLVISHADNDHSGGAKSLISSIPVKDVLVGERVWSLKSIRQRYCRAGQQWAWDGVDFEVLYPFKGKSKRNDASCVIQIRAQENRLLLTGDISGKVESQLVKRYGDKLQSDFLIIPHHGSNGSSWSRFVQTVSAKWGIASTGYRNRFKFPRETVIRRYQEANTEVISTADQGSIEVYIQKDEGISLKKWRQENWRIWTSAP